VCVDESCDSGALMRAADDAMYAMKRGQAAGDGDLDAVA
jgi:hypothetical protein